MANKRKAVIKLSQTDYATARGWTRGYVTQLKQAGRLVMTEDGKVDVEASDLLHKQTEDPNRDDVKARHAEKRGKDSKVDEIGGAKPVKPKKDPKPHDPDHLKFVEGRAKEQHFKALQAELDYKKNIGELVSMEDMKAAVTDLITIFRQNLENMPHRISAELVGKEINDIRSTLKHEINAELTNLERGCNEKIHSLNEATQ